MEKQKKSKQNGITLIALVISIIVMLILAGVSINAIVGENGVLTKAQYATFLNEMSAVEEAVQMWKAGEIVDSQGNKNTAIPTKSMCTLNELVETERLKGEIGYYRTWSINKVMPSASILSSADSFNRDFGAELVPYPAGIQDLYYLDNEACGIDSKKTYLIDAATGIVYSKVGISLKGVRCYSSSMAKAVMSGNNIAPEFEVAEVSGDGTDEKLAGNIQDEFLDDGTTKNPNYNPYGFKIIASNNNIFKLYNNGDLYCKGIKGAELNSSPEEMDRIDQYNFTEWSVEKCFPNITGYKKLIQGSETMYLIDNDGNLWAFGSNNTNKLGLTAEEQIEYTGREAIKLNVDGKKVSRVFDFGSLVFVITEDNSLYSAGINDFGQACVGNNQVLSKFTEITALSKEQISKIYKIYSQPTGDGKCTIIRIGNDENQEFYYAGKDGHGKVGNNTSNTYLTLTKIWEDFSSEVVEVVNSGASLNMIRKDGTLWHTGYRNYDGGPGGYSLSGGNTRILQAFEPSVFNCSTKEQLKIKELYRTAGILIARENEAGKKEYWGAANSNSQLGLQKEIKTSKYEKIAFPEEMLKNDEIKEVYPTNDNIYYIMKSGKVWASGSIVGLGKGKNDKEKPSGIICITDYSLPLIETAYEFYTNDIITAFTDGCILFKGKDGKLYTTGNSNIMYGNDILQGTWAKMNPVDNGNEVAIKYVNSKVLVDRNNNLWVVGNNSKYLGFGDSNVRSINNYEKVNDANINGKVEKAFVDSYTIAVQTTDGKLFVAGDYKNIDVYGEYCFPGWNESEGNSYNFKEISGLGKIELAEYNGFGRVVISEKDNAKKMYAWGRIFTWDPYSKQPTEVSFAEINNIKKVIANYTYSFVITNEGKLYAAGYKPNYIGMNATSTLTEHPNFKGIKVKDICSLDVDTHYVLTEDGEVYGWGKQSLLGIGSSSTEVNIDIKKLPIDNVDQIVAGSGFCIAVKKDGTVWGTGTNQYGMLGRWVGSPRGSRYRTAFDWVECPDLEI